MKIKITGDMRDIANSAWISTINEIRAAAREHDDVKKLVGFLVKDHHTSPFECITITIEGWDSEFDPDDQTGDFRLGPYSRQHSEARVVDGCYEFSYSLVSIDLLNFIKWYQECQEIKNPHPIIKKIWNLFKGARPELSEMLLNFGPIGDHKITREDVEASLGAHNMKVEMVSLHDVKIDSCSRATWRVKCPLSIAVQILRHRKASYNMVSGKYRVILQDMISTVDDCQEIFGKFGVNLDKYLGVAEGSIAVYRRTMRLAKKARNDEVISNQEYKRLREFARFILPEGRMTELYVTYYLDDFYNNFVKLRNSTHAQMEHVWIAQEMQRLLDESRKSK